MRSAVFGDIVEDDAPFGGGSVPGFWRGPAVVVPMLGAAPIPATFYFGRADADFVAAAERAYAHLAALREDVRADLAGRLFAMFRAFDELTGLTADLHALRGVDDPPPWMRESIARVERLARITEPGLVWDAARPAELLFARRKTVAAPVCVGVTFRCLWDDEHGAQAIFLEGRTLLSVGPDEGELI